MKKVLFICAALMLFTANATANNIASSTMWFSGALTFDQITTAYTGTIDAKAGIYYIPGGPGTTWNGSEWVTADGSTAVGGFDVYAKEGGTAYVEGLGTEVIGSDHDAYSAGGLWGVWYEPDVADWDKYSLELTADHWYLRYTSTGESPMSGTIDWSTMIAAETDLGTQNGVHDGSLVHGGGAGAWDWDCGWGVEVIPLELPGFNVTVIGLSGGDYAVALSPTVPEPATICLLGLGGLALLRRKHGYGA